jgi:3-oxoacyl-[acyl-carrier protein] reductase
MKFKENTRALVCGASGGIGEATAVKLAELGVQVTLVARTESKLKKIAESLPGSGHDYIAADFTDDLSMSNLIKVIESKGGYSIFVNNSGGPKGGALMDAESENFELGLKAHILSAQLILKTVVPQMKKFGQGRLINIISTSVKIPIPNLGVSNTIRGAVASWSKTLSLELGPHNITVNNVLPGYTTTSRLTALIEGAGERLGKTTDEIESLWKAKVPMARFGAPEEVASAVCFLASDEASYVNGVSLQVDGGRTGSI